MGKKSKEMKRPTIRIDLMKTNNSVAFQVAETRSRAERLYQISAKVFLNPLILPVYFYFVFHSFINLASFLIHFFKRRG